AGITAADYPLRSRRGLLRPARRNFPSSFDLGIESADAFAVGVEGKKFSALLDDGSGTGLAVKNAKCAGRVDAGNPLRHVAASSRAAYSTLRCSADCRVDPEPCRILARSAKNFARCSMFSSDSAVLAKRSALLFRVSRTNSITRALKSSSAMSFAETD